MEKIQIFDNFFSNEEIEKCKKITSSSNWSYGHRSSETNIVSTPFWYMELSSNEFFTVYLKQKIEKTLKKNLK